MALLLVTSVALLAADRHDPETFVPARRLALEATGSLNDGVDRMVEPMVGAWTGAREFGRWRDENQRLRHRIEVLEGDRGRATDDGDELRRLMAAVDIDSVADVDTVTARVIVDRRSAAGHVIEIDKGTRHGIRSGMPVVTGSGLVGLIEVATGDRASVRPITASDVTIGVRSAADYGVATGGGTAGLTLTIDPRRPSEPSDDARFVTAGTDRSRFPPQLPIGRLVRHDDGQLGLDPFVDFDRLGYLTVLLWRAAP